MRTAGVLLAVSSLPSKTGIGDFGPEAYRFIDLLIKAGMRQWQILPLNPLGYGHSPYQPYSSYAMDEIYISLEALQQQGLIKSVRSFHPKAKQVDYEAIREFKEAYLKEAFAAFKETKKYRAFIEESWVKPYANFRALKKSCGGAEWLAWPDEYKQGHQAVTLNSQQQEEVRYQCFLQYILDQQWDRLKQAANKKGISILGDMPFYVGMDSADVWNNQDYFLLERDGRPSFIAGVPPDYFSETGQRWGNPIYDWEKLRQHHFHFWVERLRYASKQLDCIRIDHFRAFDTYWKIPASCLTAVEGEWVEAPGYAFFDYLLKELPNLQIVAEDLGMLRPEVLELRDYYHFKGMKIIQFTYNSTRAMDEMADRENMIIYTGTHDNQTLKGWLGQMSSSQKNNARRFLKKAGCEQTSLVDSFLAYCLKSEASLAILPMQDILGLSDAARMNVPGTVNEKNWTWRMKSLDEFEQRIDFLKKLIRKENR